MSENSDFPEMDYFLNESKSDVFFRVDGQRLPALKAVLAMKSRVFEAMFSNNWKESTDKEVLIEDTTALAFISMIRFIYSEQLVLNYDKDYKRYKLAIDVCKLGHRYQLNRLAKRVEHLLRSLIDMNSIEEIYVLAVDYQISDLINASKAFIGINFKEFIAKDMNRLKRLNDLTNQSLFELMVEMSRYVFRQRVANPCSRVRLTVRQAFRARADAHRAGDPHDLIRNHFKQLMTFESMVELNQLNASTNQSLFETIVENLRKVKNWSDFESLIDSLQKTSVHDINE